MQKSIHHFPIKEGTWKIIHQIESQPEYGIYRCHISNPGVEKKKFFVFNEENYYTHLDITVAREYGLTVVLIQDEKPNLLHYPKDCLMSGSYLF